MAYLRHVKSTRFLARGLHHRMTAAAAVAAVVAAVAVAVAVVAEAAQAYNLRGLNDLPLPFPDYLRLPTSPTRASLKALPNGTLCCRGETEDNTCENYEQHNTRSNTLRSAEGQAKEGKSHP